MTQTQLNPCMLLHVYKNHYLTDKLDTEKVIKFNADSRIDRRKRTAVTIQFIVVITISNKAIFFNKFSNNFIYFLTQLTFKYPNNISHEIIICFQLFYLHLH